MRDIHEVPLHGCRPEPLMSYLKSLGILRLVSEQADPDAVARWRNDHFILSSKLDIQNLINFFLNDYMPTPIIGPWAGGSGFFGKDNRKAVNAIAISESPRAGAYQRVIEHAKSILNEEGIKDKPSEKVKEELLRRYRREMPDQFVQWMDAAMVLQSVGQAFAPVLGTGGNDGRMDFSQNFMLRLIELKLLDPGSSTKAQAWLQHALFGQPISGLCKTAVGQFSPGRAGGPNAAQGMEGTPTDNPWDFVLMLEGTLMLAGSVVRRLGIASTDKAAFPFTVRARAVGKGSLSESELSGARGELWLPLWDRFVTRMELEALFAEGRAQFSGRLARDAVEFARAVAELGVDRGVRSFARYGFLKRSGKAYLATAMDRFQVPERRREGTALLQRPNAWLNRFRRACSTKETPGRLKAAVRRIESAIFDYCRYGRREEMQEVLVALGLAERRLAVTGGQRGGKEMCRPLGGLSPQWVETTHDGSVEFDIALALAGIHDRQARIGGVRTNVEPVSFDSKKRRWVWQPSGPHVVWNSAELSTNMAAVLARRMMDGTRARCNGLPLDFRRGVSLDAVATFLRGEVDDRQIEDLLWGLIIVNHHDAYPNNLRRAIAKDVLPLPREYALLKLLFLPRPLIRKWEEERQRWQWRLTRTGEQGVQIRPEPRVLPLLRNGRVAEACRIAYQRLRSSGLKPLPGPKPSGVWRKDDWEPDRSVDPKRLAGALLIPVGDFIVNELILLVTRQDEGPGTKFATHVTGGARPS